MIPFNSQLTHSPERVRCATGFAFFWLGRTKTPSRRGFSLIEVIMATAILMGSTIVLMRLAGMGREQFSKAKLIGEAQSYSETILNEIALGIRPVREVLPQAFFPNSDALQSTRATRYVADDLESDSGTNPTALYESNGVSDSQQAMVSEWMYLVKVQNVRGFPNLKSITVTVYYAPETAEARSQTTRSLVEKVSRVSRIRSSLTRWIRVPLRRTASDTTKISEAGRDGQREPLW